MRLVMKKCVVKKIGRHIPGENDEGDVMTIG